MRQLCAERIDPFVADWFERGQIEDVRGLARQLGGLGVLGMHLEGYGCAGMSATEYGLACLELEATDSGIQPRGWSSKGRAHPGVWPARVVPGD